MAEAAAYARRGLQGAAAATTLAGDINASATTIPAASLATWAGATTNGPICWTLNRGLADEESGEATGIAGNSLTGVTRGLFGTTGQTHTNGATLELTSSKKDFDEANYTTAETVGKITAANQLLVSDAANSLIALDVAASRIVGRAAAGSVDDLTAAQVKTLLAIVKADISDLGTIPTTVPFNTTHTWTISTPAVESSDTDFIIPLTIRPASGETVFIESVSHKINSGTSVSWDLTVNGTPATGFSTLSTTTTTANTDPANVSLAAGDKVKPDISAVAGTPRNWEVTVVIRHVCTLA